MVMVMVATSSITSQTNKHTNTHTHIRHTRHSLLALIGRRRSRRVRGVFFFCLFLAGLFGRSFAVRK